MNIPPGSSIQSITALLANSTAAHTTTLGPFNISGATSGGLWLLALDVRFGVPSAAINEDILLQDAGGATIMQFHTNMGVLPMPPAVILLIFPYPGIRLGAVVANQMSYSVTTPATVSGPGYSVNIVAYQV